MWPAAGRVGSPGTRFTQRRGCAAPPPAHPGAQGAWGIPPPCYPPPPAPHEHVLCGDHDAEPALVHVFALQVERRDRDLEEIGPHVKAGRGVAGRGEGAGAGGGSEEGWKGGALHGADSWQACAWMKGDRRAGKGRNKASKAAAGRAARSHVPGARRPAAAVGHDGADLHVQEGQHRDDARHGSQRRPEAVAGGPGGGDGGGGWRLTLTHADYTQQAPRQPRQSSGRPSRLCAGVAVAPPAVPSALGALDPPTCWRSWPRSRRSSPPAGTAA